MKRQFERADRRGAEQPEVLRFQLRRSGRVQGFLELVEAAGGRGA